MKTNPSVGGDIVTACALAAEPRRAKRPWIVGRRTTTYGSLTDRISRLTRIFADAGLAPGDRVILSSANDHELAVLFLALLRNGLTAVIVDAETKPRRFATLDEIAAPKGYLVDRDNVAAWGLTTAPFVLPIDPHPAPSRNLFTKLMGRKRPDVAAVERSTYPALLGAIEPAEPPSEIDPETDAYVLFTSGTTSRPKGVRISHRALFAHLRTLSEQYGYDSDARILNVLRLHHTDGLTQGPVVAFANRATVYRPFAFEIPRLGELLDLIYTYRITHLVAVPTIIALIQRLGSDYREAFQTGDFRFVISAADLLEPELWRDFEERYGTQIANLYGLTETVTGGLFCGPAQDHRRIGTVGKPVDCRARIVDDAGRELGPDEVGELQLKGDNVMSGYLSAPEATAEVLVDGWFSTGDLLSRDRDGFYHVKGRKKLLIITGGINVHPEEVTEALRRSPAVSDAVTYGEPDPTFGEKVISCVVVADGQSTTEQLLLEHCRANLESEKIPARIHLLDELPKTAAGKTRVADVRQRVAALEQRGADGSATSTAEVLLEVATRCFGAPPGTLGIEAATGDVLGWDSLAHLELVAVLERRFDVSFSTAEIMQVERLSDALRIIEEKLAE